MSTGKHGFPTFIHAAYERRVEPYQKGEWSRSFRWKPLHNEQGLSVVDKYKRTVNCKQGGVLKQITVFQHTLKNVTLEVGEGWKIISEVTMYQVESRLTL